MGFSSREFGKKQGFAVLVGGGSDSGKAFGRMSVSNACL